MALRAEHDVHQRRFSRNVGVALVLLGFIAVIFGLTVVKIQNLGAIQGFDHVVRPELVESAQ